MVNQSISVPGVTYFSPPGIYSNLTFGNGGGGAGSGQYFPLLLGNMIQDGYSAAYAGFVPGQVFGPNTPLASLNVSTVNDCINQFGAGSPLALMYASLRAKNPQVPIYLAPVLAATGTQASQTFTVTALANGSVSNGQTSGVVQYQVDGKNAVQALVNATDSQNTVALNLAGAINGNVNLPVTATASTNTVTVTAKVPGLRGNDLRGFASVASGVGVTLTGAVNSPAFFTSGAGSDATGYTNTLNALAAQGLRYYYVVPEAGCDANDGTTNGIPAEVQAFLVNQAAPLQGNRERAVFGSNDTVSHTAAVMAGLNYERIEVVQCKNLDLTPGELAATWAGCILSTEGVPLTASEVNFDGFGSQASDNWGVSAPLDGSAPSATDIQTCIISGISPLKVVAGGNTVVVKRVTSRFFTLGGSGGSQEVLDLRITDAGTVTTCDRVVDDISNAIALRFSNPRCVIGQDTSSGAPPSPPGVVTPDKVKDVVKAVLNQYGAAGLIDSVTSISQLVVQQNPPPADTSIGIQLSLYVNSLCHQFLLNVAQTVPTV